MALGQVEAGRVWVFSIVAVTLIAVGASVSATRRSHQAAAGRMREEAEPEHSAFLGVLASASNEMFILDGDTLRFTYASPSALSELGYALEEMREMTPTDIDSAFEAEQVRGLDVMEGETRSDPFEADTVFRRKDGTEFAVSVSTRRVRTDATDAFVMTAVDITEALSAEVAIRAGELRYRSLFQQAPDGIFCLDETGRCIEVNPAGAAMLGYTVEEILAKPPTDLIDAVDFAETAPRFDSLVTSGAPSFMWRLLRKDGSPIVAEVRAQRMPDGGVRTFVRDITDRVEAERSVRAAHDEIEQVFAVSPDGICVIDLDFTVTRANPALGHLAGLEQAAVIGMKCFDVLTCACCGTPECSLTKVRDEPAGFARKVDYRRLDGTSITCSLNVQPLVAEGDLIGIVEVIRDISEVVQAGEALRESEDKFRYLFDYSPTGSSLIRPSGEIEVNDALLRTLGYAREELEDGGTWPVWTHPDDLAARSEMLRSVLAGEVDIGRCEQRYIRKDGETIWADVSASLRRAADGQPDYLLTSMFDITSRKAALAVLQESESHLRVSQSVARVGHYLLDITHDRWTGSPVMCELFGLDDERPRSTAEWAALVHPEDREMVASHLRDDVLRDHRDFDLDYRIVRENDGATRWVHGQGTLEFGDSGEPEGMIGVIQDITGRKEAEIELRQIQEDLSRLVIERTAALEEANRELEAFTYSVSHDLRAPLRHVSGFVSLLVEREGDKLDKQGRHYLDTISGAVHRMGHLIDDLLELSRTGRTEMEFVDVDMDSLVAETRAMLTSNSETARVAWDIGKLPHVRGDKTLLELVWANLLGNAVKYSRGREIAHIRVGYREEQGQDVFFVSDDGVGFDMAYAGKLFGVFQRLHSDKDFEGTGIGLANVSRAVVRHGGLVWADAVPDGGATFFFSIPKGE